MVVYHLPKVSGKSGWKGNEKLKEMKCAFLKQNNKEEKDTIPALSVSTIKEALMKKWNLIYTKPTTTLPNF